MTVHYDDLGHEVELPASPTRIVSLVPSLTEAFATTAPERLVGVTDWCTHPPDLPQTRVRGTKNPDRAAILALHPDLVVANQEENRQVDVERLRDSGFPVWVTVIESVQQSIDSMRRLFVEALGVAEPDWLTEAERQWNRPPTLPPTRVVVPIWRDPWMVVGPRTFTDDLLRRLNLQNVLADAADRYPKLEPHELQALSADLVLLPDEPYVFTTEDGPEMFPGRRLSLVSGRMLTWYGPSLVEARNYLEGVVLAALNDN